MKKAYFIVAICMVGSCMFLSGCGNKAEQNEENTENRMYSNLEQQILEYEEKYASEEFSLEDYLALADLYHEAFLWKDERILLEQCLRTYDDEAIVERLRSLTVNLEEEDAFVAGVIREVFALIEDGKWDAKVVDALGDLGRYEQVLPQSARGCRNYYVDNGQNGVLFFSVGYENGIPYTRLAQLDEAGHLYMMTVMNDQLQVFDGVGTWENENFCYDGAFDLWTMNGQDGTVVHETATMKNNLLDGDYQAQHAVVNMDGEVRATLGVLWDMRDSLSYEVYTGSFLDGKSTVEQPEDVTCLNWMQSGNYVKVIAYAYNETKEKALWMGTEKESDILFDAEALGMLSVPSIISYTPGTKPVANSVIEREELQIRICDGQVQFYDGKVWVDAGSVEALRVDNSVVESEENNDVVENMDGNEKAMLADNRNIGDLAVASDSDEKDTSLKSETSKTPSSGSSSNAVTSSGGSNSAGTSAPSQGNNSPAAPTEPAAPAEPSAPTEPTAPTEPATPAEPEEPEIEWSDDML